MSNLNKYNLDFQYFSALTLSCWQNLNNLDRKSYAALVLFHHRHEISIQALTKNVIQLFSLYVL